MNNWYSLRLGDGMVAAGPLIEIEEVFRKRFTAVGKPVEMAVFTRSEMEGRLHCEIVAYFSPAASEVANAFDAESCMRPAREGLDLLAGSPHCWAVLFPDGSG